MRQPHAAVAGDRRLSPSCCCAAPASPTAGAARRVARRRGRLVWALADGHRARRSSPAPSSPAPGRTPATRTSRASTCDDRRRRPGPRHARAGRRRPRRRARRAAAAPRRRPPGAAGRAVVVDLRRPAAGRRSATSSTSTTCPALLVGLHVAGATALWAMTVWLVLSTSTREPVAARPRSMDVAPSAGRYVRAMTATDAPHPTADDAGAPRRGPLRGRRPRRHDHARRAGADEHDLRADARRRSPGSCCRPTATRTCAASC